MILIFSVYGDYTTTRVCHWLNCLNQPYLRVNSECFDYFFDRLSTPDGEVIFDHQGEPVDLNKVDTVWYRKSGLRHVHYKANYAVSDHDFFFEKGKVLSGIVQDESQTLSLYIHWLLENKRHLGKRFNANLNKLIVLEQAKQKGLKVPDTFILTRKADLKTLLEQRGDLITKAIRDGVYEFNAAHAYYSYTEKISLDQLEQYPDEFSPTLFQSLIEKYYELRIFFFDNAFYPMAIFSQEHEETQIDSRKGDQETRGRRIPYQLSSALEKKLSALMEELQLNTGSIDMIVDTNGNEIFLEVNPVGQFSMVSDPCNYYLEKKIAQYLAHEE